MTELSRGKSIVGLLAWVALASGAGAIGSLASIRAREFYAVLDRPSWSPPGWLFGPVWTTLYILMGIAAWLVWRERDTLAGAARKRGLGLFVVQLVLNALWSWLFFAWRFGAASAIEIVILFGSIAMTMWYFSRVSRAAAWLLAPYLAWVGFATALTWTIWRMNPGQL